MRFKNWLESDNNKLMILVHPDCCVELGAEAVIEYTNLLKQHLPRFDYVITHFFIPDGRPWSNYWDDQMKEAHISLVETIKSLSNVAVSRNTYACSYDKELPDYLIENPNTTIYMAGGYEANCLWMSYQRLFVKLKWLMDEQNHQVYYYKPLIYTTREYGGLNRNRDYMKPQDYNDFSTSKVNYVSDLHLPNMD